MSSPAEWWASLPPVSKVWMTGVFGFTAGQYLKVLNPAYAVLDFDLIFRKFQVWRLIGNFFYIGPFSLMWPAMFLMIAQYSVNLETQQYAGKTADFLFMILFGMTLLDVAALVVPVFAFGFCSISLIFMVIYVWSRHNEETGVKVMGMFSIKGFYVPWGFAFLELVFGRNIFTCLLGILVGHLYYFLHDLYPLKTGQQYLVTPKWLYDAVLKWEAAGPQRAWQAGGAAAAVQGRQFGARGSAPQPPPPTQQQQSRAFQGRSYRLRDD